VKPKRYLTHGYAVAISGKLVTTDWIATDISCVHARGAGGADGALAGWNSEGAAGKNDGEANNFGKLHFDGFS